MESEEKEPFRVNGKWICSYCFQSFASKFSVRRHIVQRHKSQESADIDCEPPSKRARKQRDECSVPEEVPLFDVFQPEDLQTCNESPIQAVGDVDKDDVESQTQMQTSDWIESDNDFVKSAEYVVKELCDFFCKESLSGKNIQEVLASDDERNYSDSDSDITFGDEASSSGGCQEATSDSDTPSFRDISSDDEESKPLYDGSRLSYKEHLLSVIAYATKHNLNMSQATDLLELIELHTPHSCKSERSVNNLKVNLTGRIDLVYHDMCEKCYRLFPDESSCFVCETEGCGGLRYQGSKEEQVEKRRKCYFVSTPVVEQFQDILQRDGMWEKVQANIQERYRPSSGHIRDVIDGAEYRKHCHKGGILSSPNNLSVLLNTDGIPIFKSSGVGVWRVFMAINEILPKERFLKKNIALWGLWQGKGRPIMHAFLKPLVLTLNRISKNGFTITVSGSHLHVRIYPLLSTMDLQAKSYWMCLVPHNGDCGCSTCYIKSISVKSGKGHAKAYQYADFKTATLRTAKSFQEDAELAHNIGKTVHGVKGYSLVLSLCHHDIVKGTCIDYMHGLLLGVCKTLLSLWFSPSKYNKGADYFIGDKIKSVDKMISKMKPPDFIARYPRPLQGNLPHWKASELKAWLLYYGLPILLKVLPEKYVLHFALLVEGVHILLGDDISPTDLGVAEMLLEKFYKKFASLYGAAKCGLNVHNVVHYAQNVRWWGPLWCFSCFAFEDLNGDCVDAVHGTRDVARQVVCSFFATRKLQLAQLSLTDDSLVKCFVKKMSSVGRGPKDVTMASGCEVIGRTTKFSMTVEVQDLLPSCTPENPTWEKAFRVRKGSEVFYSAQYKRMKQRICHVILYSDAEGSVAPASVLYYLHETKTLKVFAVVEKLEVCQPPRVLKDLAPHFMWVRKARENSLLVLQVTDILEKVAFLDGNNRNPCVVRTPNLFEKE